MCSAQAQVCFGAQIDMRNARGHVRFGPEADIATVIDLAAVHLEISTGHSESPHVAGKAEPYSSSPVWLAGSLEFCRHNHRIELQLSRLHSSLR